MRIILVLIVTLLMSWSNLTISLDVVRVERPLSESDKRSLYKNAVLRAALDASIPEFGPYKIEVAKRVLSPSRAKIEIVEGDVINTYITSASVDWENIAIPMRFPIRKGLTGFRLILVHKDEIARFKDVTSKEDLKKFVSGTIGVGSVAKTLLSHEFDIVKSPSFDSAFHMLAAKRFDFISRGVNEVHREINSGHPAFENLVIAPNIAMHIPLASYIFVSPAYPKLARRFASGLKVIANNGAFDAVFEEFHGENLRRAELDKRRIIFLENPNLPRTASFDYKNLWRKSIAIE